MESLTRVISLLFICTCSSMAAAQLRSTVQLPTFQQFSMSTTVLVPDRGSVHVGGVDRSLRHTARRRTPCLGPVARSDNAASLSNGVSVAAFIHDHREIDEAVLAEWKGRKASSKATTAGVTRSRVQRNSQIDSTPAMPRVSEARKQAQAEQRAQSSRARADFDLAVRLEEKGKTAAARAMYRSAFKRADAELKTRILSRIGTGSGINAAAATATPRRRPQIAQLAKQRALARQR